MTLFFGNHRDSKILSLHFDVKINPIIFSYPQKNLKRNYQQNRLIAKKTTLIIYRIITA